uniref:hypothetical protein n=1 Tax=Streptomyces sp. GESEQ-35 TaxID=2812657 RepID=UPI001B338282
MRYVIIERQAQGTYWHDPSPYLAELPRLAPVLPPGARAFATHPEHYDFSAPRCVKDLRPTALPQTAGAPDQFQIHFTWQASQDHVLTVHYHGVTSVQLEADEGGSLELSDFNTVRLDELLPHESGCSHELRLTTGSIRILCQDL